MVDLRGYAPSDVQDFLDSPFWQVLIEEITQRFQNAYIDLRRGDISVRNAGVEGVVFRSNEALRGAMIEDEYILHFGESLLEEVRALNEDAEKNSTDDSEQGEDNE